jgi:cell division protein FtsB
MASARSAARNAAPQRSAAAPPSRTGPRAVKGGRPGRRASGIRWDRVGRVALLMVFALIVVLYIGPARTYVATLKESSQRSAEVQRLAAENRRLRERRAALRNPSVLEAEARKLGMVRPGERPYILDNLPGARPKPSR